MMKLPAWAIAALVGFVLAATSSPVAAARIRYHYVPPPGASPGPVDAQLTGGERLSVFGGVSGPAPGPPPKCTCRMTYRHPSTGQQVRVPMAFPDATPRIEHRFGRLIYNYGSDTIEVVFQPDGSLDVIYNTGLFRGP